MNRNFVQKALVIVSNLPFYGLISSIIQPVTQVYFEQKNFDNTDIISEAYQSLEATLSTAKIEDISIGYSTRMLLHYFKEKVMMVWKLILLRGRVIVFSKKPSQVSSVIYSLLSLYPGQLCFGNFQYCHEYYKHLQVYGLPLKLFDSDYVLHPYFSIFQLADLEKPGYLIGCTNQMILEHPKSSPFAVINLEKNKIIFNLPSKLSQCIKLNSHETKFIKDLAKVKLM
jgi:Transport protein Avl9